jgi:acetyl esterase/lipase
VLAHALAREGLAVASISYRFATTDPHPAQIEDCRSALRWLRVHADELGLDAERIVAIGASAGGHLSALLGTQDDTAQPDAEDPLARASTRPKCVVAISAPFDLRPRGDFAPATFLIQMVTDLLGVSGAEPLRRLELLRERAVDASPIVHVSAGDVPILIVQGQRDRLVPLHQAREMARAAESCKVRARLVELEDGGHCEFLFRRPGDWLEEPPRFWSEIRSFLGAELLAAAAPSGEPENGGAGTGDIGPRGR